MDPYEILNLSPDASIDEVNRAYFYIAKIYHPNKGGNEEEFLRFQKAYKQIIEAHSQGQRPSVVPKDFEQLRGQGPVSVDHQYNPADFVGSTSGRFSHELFNQKFRENNSQSSGQYTYNIDELSTPSVDRRADDYKREHAKITAQAESIVPFGNGRFNNATFNQAFVHLKEMSKRERGEVEEAGIPNPTTSREIMQCTNLEDPRNPGTGDYTGFNQAYNDHQNPDRYDQGFLSQFQGKADITKIGALCSEELRNRVANRQNISLDYNKERLVTDLSVPIGAESASAPSRYIEGLEGRDGREDREDMCSRMAALRAPLHVPMSRSLGPERPVASSAKSANRETAGYVAQPAAILTAHGRPPPIQKKRKKPQHQPQQHQYQHHHQHQQHQQHQQSQSTVEEEIRQMKRHLKQQNKIIKQLSRRLGDT